MKPSETFYVREFAKMAGVTVRSLHYYDQIGLLKPSLHTQSKHRLYKRDDMLRLQQILTFKYMGFSLDEIREMLNSPRYDLRESLALQKQAIDTRIQQLQRVSAALGQMLDDETLDLKQAEAVIAWLKEGEKWQFTARYYTEEQHQWIADRAQQFTLQDMMDATQAWAELWAQFEAKRHLPPEHPEVQVLAAEHDRLVTAFTGGKADIEGSLRALWQDVDHFPAEIGAFDQDLLAFMGRAREIYREAHSG